jgi:RIO kinase 1
LARAIPDNVVVADDCVDVSLGVLKTGKEAEISVVERTAPDGRTCLLALKRYRPRTISHKGELQELGFERAPTFRNDIVYRDGRRFTRRSRDLRAIEQMTNYGKALLKEKWHGHEFDVMARLWDAGADVPYPVENHDNGMLMEYIGVAEGAAPRLAQARLTPAQVRAAWDLLLDNLRTFLEAGIVHSDLSAYNILWWDERLWFIDFPQAVDIAHSPHAFDFLHRDVTNIGRWFSRQGVDVDAEALFVELLAQTFPMR